MAKHAGSALDIIKNEPSEWLSTYLGSKNTSWFIFQGATNPPGKTHSCKHNNGEYRNLLKDLKTAKKFIKNHQEFSLERYNFNNLSEKKQISKDIKNFLKNISECNEPTLPVLYYTGHGIIGSGNWSFNDGQQISIKDVEGMIPSTLDKVFIIVDSCFSGHWADYCMKTTNCKMEVLAASSYCMESFDNKFSEWLFNNNQNGIVPVYGLYRHNDEDHPYKREFVSIETFIDNHIIGKSVKEIYTTISLTCAGTKYSAIFAQKKSVRKSPSNRQWSKLDNLNNIETDIRVKKDSNMNLVAINYIDNIHRYLLFFETPLINRTQAYRNGLLDEDFHTWISEHRQEGMKITSCCPCDNGWFVVMTGGFENTESFIMEKDEYRESHIPNNYKLSGIAYNSTNEKYLIYGEEKENDCHTTHKWFLEGDIERARLWLRDQISEGYTPYHIFSDPKSLKTLISVTSKRELYLSNVELAMDYTHRQRGQHIF